MAVCELHGRIASVAESKNEGAFPSQEIHQGGYIISVLFKTFRRSSVRAVSMCLQFHSKDLKIFRKQGNDGSKIGLDGGSAPMDQYQPRTTTEDLVVHP